MARRGSNKSRLVFFDLEATGLIQSYADLPDIIQVAAMDNDDNIFDRYILPEKPMTASAMQVTGLLVEGDSLLLKGVKVPTVELKKAMGDFLDWLREAKEKSGEKLILLAYNGTKFDFRVLRNAFTKCGLTAEAKEVIEGFADPFRMALEHIRKRQIGNYRLGTLVRKYCGIYHDAHNAIGDTKGLKALYFAKFDGLVSLPLHTSSY